MLTAWRCMRRGTHNFQILERTVVPAAAGDYDYTPSIVLYGGVMIVFGCRGCGKTKEIILYGNPVGFLS